MDIMIFVRILIWWNINQKPQDLENGLIQKGKKPKCFEIAYMDQFLQAAKLLQNCVYQFLQAAKLLQNCVYGLISSRSKIITKLRIWINFSKKQICKKLLINRSNSCMDKILQKKL